MHAEKLDTSNNLVLLSSVSPTNFFGERSNVDLSQPLIEPEIDLDRLHATSLDELEDKNTSTSQ